MEFTTLHSRIQSQAAGLRVKVNLRKSRTLILATRLTEITPGILFISRAIKNTYHSLSIDWSIVFQQQFCNFNSVLSCCQMQWRQSILQRELISLLKEYLAVGVTVLKHQNTIFRAGKERDWMGFYKKGKRLVRNSFSFSQILFENKNKKGACVLH